MSLQSFLMRLIGMCMLPTILLAAWLAIDSVRTTRSEIDLAAANLARNFATAIDQNLAARIGALNMLAMSPLAAEAPRWSEVYREAQGFQQNYGSNIIVADTQMRTLFNTRVPYGTALPMLPRPAGRAAAPTAAETGRPAVGDIFIGPITREPMVAIAVPGVRDGKVDYLILTTIETRQFQDRLDRVALPDGWSLALLDGAGEPIARRSPPGLDNFAEVDPVGRFLFRSQLSPWSVNLEIPREVYRAPLYEAAAALAIAVLGTTLIGILGGTVASRRLAGSVASLAKPPAADAALPDITEIVAVRRLLDESAERRVSAEAGQRETEKQFRATFEQAAVGIALVALDGRWLQVNHKLCDIVGYPPDQLLKLSFQDITHPEDLGRDLAHVERLLAGDVETYAIEKRYVRKDGALVWVNLTVALVRRTDGRPHYFISVVEDIERRKQAEAALKSREAMLKEAQHLAGLGTWAWDLRADRHQWSDEIYSIYGRDPGLPPAVYPEVQKYFTPESWARLADSVEAGLAQGRSYECDAEVVRADGTRRWITARGKATRDAAGNIAELTGTVQDITERKLAADVLREFSASLEQRVEQRTAELTAANRELDSFAYAVSHDLRAPLRSIDGFAKVLEEDYTDRLDEEGIDALHRVRGAAQRMGELIDDLLALSRLTRSEMNLESVDLVALARPIADELRRSDPARSVAFVFPPKQEVRGDPRLLALLLQNLLGNSWKFTGRHATARIELGVTTIADEPVCFVRDDGAGFEMAEAANLFAPFQRLHSVRDFPGTGIGLATVRRIVQRHGGRVWAEGVVEEGATIHFTLPA